MRRTTLLASFLALGPLFVACATTEGHDRAASTAMRVESVGGAAGQTQLRLDETLNAMDQIVAQGNQDPKPAFDAFSKGFAQFQSELSNLGSERDALQKESQAWFDEFAKQNSQIQDPDLRKKGEKRLADLKEQTNDTSARFSKFLDKTRGFEGRIADLRKFLGNDLSPAGIDAVEGKIKDATKEGRELAADLGDLSKRAAALAQPLRAAGKK